MDPGQPGSAARDLLVRPAEPRDYADFCRLFPHLEVDDPVPSPEAWEAVLVFSAMVAEDERGVVGYCFWQEYEDTGYVRNVVVDPGARRRGVGVALMNAMAERFRGGGKHSWCLNVKPENRAALGLYGRLGMRVRYQATALRLNRGALAATCAAGDRESRVLLPARDPVVEAVFRLPRGQLKHARGLGRLLLECPSLSGEGCDGVAVFDRHFSGAFPFRATERDAAAGLLRGIRRAQLAQLTIDGEDRRELSVVVEDDVALRDMLAGLGATVRHEILHLHGRL